MGQNIGWLLTFSPEFVPFRRSLPHGVIEAAYNTKMPQTEGKPERWGLFANINGDRLLRDGAKVQILLLNGQGKRWEVRGLSRGGRRITRYVRLAHLTNWRVGMIPPQDREGNSAPASEPTKEAAEKRWEWAVQKKEADNAPDAFVP